MARRIPEKAKDFKGTVRKLAAVMAQYRLVVGIVILFAIASTVFHIAGPKILAKATTALATGWIAKLNGTGGIDFGYIGRVLLFMLGLYLISGVFSFVQHWMMSGVTQTVC